MLLMLGNLSSSDIASRLGIELSQEDSDFLTQNRQEKVNDTPLGEGKWHCYDIPFVVMCDTVHTAEIIRDLFMRYSPFPKSTTFQIGWER